jgi:cell division protein FtsB
MRLRITVSLPLAILFITIAISGLSAQTNNSKRNPTASSSPVATPSPEVTPAATSSPSPIPADGSQNTVSTAQPKVTKVVSGHLELDDIIVLEVDHLADWMATDTNDAKKLVPYINGRAIRGNYPEEIHSTNNQLQFHLELTTLNKDVWTDLLGAPSATHRLVSLSIGPEDQGPFLSVFDRTNELPLTVISPVYGVVALLVILFTVIVFVWLARTTNIIRETGPAPMVGKLRPYNLGRTQMAFWFFLIYVSYLVIWLITNALDTITASLLGLMGISAGTALSEAMIDSGKDTAKSAQLQELTAEKQVVEQNISELQAQIDNLNAMTSPTPESLASRDSLNQQLQDDRKRLAEVSDQSQALALPSSAKASVSFLRDILSDSSGYSFHRFQIFAWTIVLGIIFVSAVYNSLNMPEFSSTLLGLMGISSGTYIGFKFPEKK